MKRVHLFLPFLSCLQRLLVRIQLVNAVFSRHVDEIVPAALTDDVLWSQSEIVNLVNRLELAVATNIDCVNLHLLRGHLVLRPKRVHWIELEHSH